MGDIYVSSFHARSHFLTIANFSVSKIPLPTDADMPIRMNIDAVRVLVAVVLRRVAADADNLWH